MTLSCTCVIVVFCHTDTVVIGCPGEDEEEKGPCPDFSKYLYFLFVPTLVYRDDYPRWVLHRNNVILD